MGIKCWKTTVWMRRKSNLTPTMTATLLRSVNQACSFLTAPCSLTVKYSYGGDDDDNIDKRQKERKEWARVSVSEKEKKRENSFSGTVMRVREREGERERAWSERKRMPWGARNAFSLQGPFQIVMQGSVGLTCAQRLSARVLGVSARRDPAPYTRTQRDVSLGGSQGSPGCQAL